MRCIQSTVCTTVYEQDMYTLCRSICTCWWECAHMVYTVCGLYRGAIVCTCDVYRVTELSGEIATTVCICDGVWCESLGKVCKAKEHLIIDLLLNVYIESDMIG